MDQVIKNHENMLKFSALVNEALVASSITGERRIAVYKKKLDQIYEQVAPKLDSAGSRLEKAELLFEWLWERKPFRYRTNGPFKLHQVIDAQISKSIKTVGNCLGLTLLYNCLLKKLGIFAEAMYLENAFGRGPHVLTILPVKKGFMEIENILPDGFDYRGHLHNPLKRRWGDRELVADIYHSTGNEEFEKSKFSRALKSYNEAIRLNPAYEKAALNRAILLDRLKMDNKG